jgi:hypothetical protein
MSSTHRLSQSAGALTTAAVKVMDEGLPWYHELGAQERAWVSEVAGAGIRAFLEWFDQRDPHIDFTADVFGAAPRELAGAISLEQTVALVRTTIGVVESAVDELVDPADRPALREAILRYSREIAFSAAEVYARAAEVRGAWDARLEAYVVDAVVRDEFDDSLHGRLAALGWRAQRQILVLAGEVPSGEIALDVLRRSAQHHGVDLLTGIQGNVLLMIVGANLDSERVGRLFAPHFGSGPIVMSTPVTSFAHLPTQVRHVLCALRAAPGWPYAPRPVRTDELLPERALAGDRDAVTELIAQVVEPLRADPSLYDTASAYLEQAPGIEPTARALFIHANTVRYRLRKIAEATGYTPTDPRGAFVLRTALALGRILPEPTSEL